MSIATTGPLAVVCNAQALGMLKDVQVELAL
jgi:hypothetical protein